jgi:organic radical activating enzyme
MSTATAVTNPIADAIAEGVIGGRLWLYANYHCNLECTYCLTESGPNVNRRQLDADWMVARAVEAKELGFTSVGVTGGEPFMVASMPETIARLSDILPTIVLSNGSLFHGPRLERIVAALAGKDVHIQISLDAPDAIANDTKRGEENFEDVCSAIPRLVQRGLKVRIATTTEDLADADKDRLCALHRTWGVPDEDHVVRPIVSRGRAALDGIGIEAGVSDLPSELCLTVEGAFWSAFGPTVRNGIMDTDLLISRTTAPLHIPANIMLRLAQGRPQGADATLGIR